MASTMVAMTRTLTLVVAGLVLLLSTAAALVPSPRLRAT